MTPLRVKLHEVEKLVRKTMFANRKSTLEILVKQPLKWSSITSSSIFEIWNIDCGTYALFIKSGITRLGDDRWLTIYDIFDYNLNRPQNLHTYIAESIFWSQQEKIPHRTRIHVSIAYRVMPSNSTLSNDSVSEKMSYDWVDNWTMNWRNVWKNV